MKMLIIYDSVFGNTQQLAQAMRSALESSGQVAALRPKEVKPGQLANIDLLIVGSPTRGFRPTEDLAALLKQIPPGSLKGVKAAVFDTRFSVDDLGPGLTRFVVKTGGYAGPRLAKELVRLGAQMILPAEGFIVKDTEGPLKEGELERAAGWANKLASQIKGATS
jgi:flavodoxin